MKKRLLAVVLLLSMLAGSLASCSGSDPEEGLSGEGEKYYQIPFGVLVQEKYTNLIPVGRMINADREAFGALRVMVNLNQMGEAAGVAAYMAIDKNVPLQRLDGKEVRKVLQKGGSIL